jgi:hypothetical protein|eukprot:4087380-Prymnesium_polylepis.1
MGSTRHALEFKQIMDATPDDLTRWPTNIYSQIAIALKGGELREPGLANLASRLALRIPAAAHLPDWLAQVEGRSVESRGRGRLRSKLPTLFRVSIWRASEPHTPGRSSSDLCAGACHPGEAYTVLGQRSPPPRSTIILARNLVHKSTSSSLVRTSTSTKPFEVSTCS